jgi:hypothetical protein
VRRQLIILTTLLTLTTLLLAGCDRVQIGWVETSLPGQFEASYQTFSGTERRRVRLQEGETLTLTYEATVEKGTLIFEIQDPDRDTAWSLTLEQDDAGTIDLTAEQRGTYRILVQGQETGGRFALNWETG